MTRRSVPAVLAAALAACGATPAGSPRATPPAPPATIATRPPPPPPGPGVAPTPTLIPRAVLLADPARTDVQLSPDGQRLAWIAPVEGVATLFVAPIDKLDRATSVAAPVEHYAWAYPSTQVVYLQPTTRGDVHVFRIDIAGAKPAVDLTPDHLGRVELLGAAPRRPGAIAAVLDGDVYQIELASGHRTLVYRDESGFTRFTLDDELRLVLAEKPAPDGGDELYRPNGRGWTLFDTVSFDDAEASRVVGISADDRTAYAIDSRGRNTSALVAIDLRTKAATVLATNVFADATGVVADPTTHAPIAVAFTYDRRRWYVLDAGYQADFDGIAQLVAGDDFDVASQSRSDRLWIVASRSPQHPGRYFVWDRAQRRGALLFSAYPALDRAPLVPMYTVNIPSRDGVPLIGYLSLPSAVDAAHTGTPTMPVPTVLVVHGGPWARDTWGFATLHQLLANRGYAVLSVNYRGSTGFGKQFVAAGNLEWGNHMQDDLADAARWAGVIGLARRGKLAIMGTSYGGYAAELAIAETPELFACAVDLAGPQNLATLLAAIPAPYARRIGDPSTPAGSAALAAASPLAHAAAIARPLLVAEGGRDPRVTRAEVTAVVAALGAHHVPVTSIAFPDEGHGLARAANEAAFLAAAEAFLAKFVGASFEPITDGEHGAAAMTIETGKDNLPGWPAR